MSNNAVSRALRALDEGARFAEIDEILRDGGVSETLLRERLAHLIATGDSDSAAAQRLWTSKFDDSPTVQSTRDTEVRDPAVPGPMQGESPPAVIRLDDPTPLLGWVARNRSGVFSLATLRRFEVWGVVATATLARSESIGALTLTDYGQSAAGRFAHAIGSKDLIRGVVPPSRGEPGRTARLRRLAAFGEIEDAASEILKREAVVLDFLGMEIATRSYLHALLYDALRLAWAKQSFIYVVNASPSVRSGIELVEAYALGG